MQANQTPTLVPLPFATNGTKNTIPEASQIGITPGAASLNDGFPPLTFTPIAAGGVPPAGADFNGILNLITQSIRWAHAGGRYAFSSTFSTDANVGGYPAGSVLMSADRQGSWLSLNDNNTDNPDTGPGAQWVPSHAYGVTAITGLTNSNVTLTPAQAMKPKITLAGTLTANVQVIFPAWTRDWTVVNNTTGAFTVTAKTAAGTGVVLAAGQQKITGDGTNIVQPAESIASATQSGHALPLGQATGRLLRITTITSSGTFTPGAGTTAVRVRIVGGGGGGGGAPATGASQVSIGSGGGAGAYAEGYFTSGFSGVTVTVGAAGSVGSGVAGGNGGTTSFGALMSAPGGLGGGTAGPSAPPFSPISAGGASAGSGGNIVNAGGGAAGIAIAIGVSSFAGSSGGNSMFGGGAPLVANGSNGAASPSKGGGGGGTGQQPSSAALTGGVAGAGYAIIEEFGSV